MREIKFIILIPPDIDLKGHYVANEQEFIQEVNESEVLKCCSLSGTYSHVEARNENSIGIKMLALNTLTIDTTSTLIALLFNKYKLDINSILTPYEVASRRSLLDTSDLWELIISEVGAKVSIC